MDTNITRRGFVGILSASAASLAAGASLTGCGGGSTQPAKASTDYSALAISNERWNYDAENDVYYQIGLPYCTAPEASDYESFGIYVPGAYLTGTRNADGTYTCEVNGSGKVGGYTAATAPVVLPVNTAGYSAQMPPSEYSYDGLSDYLSAGLIYVFAGCRGRANGTQDSDGEAFSGGAPWGVADLKSAVRTLRYNRETLPGDYDKVVSFGMSGGGAQSALLGVTGDAAGYEPYLERIGAPLADASGSRISDALFGSMCWCPITNLDYAGAAYEWNMGQFSDSGTRAAGTFTEALSKDLAAAWGPYVNGLGLKDTSGKALALEEGGEGVWTAGSYYDHVVGVVEDSLNKFLKNTKFPYTPSNAFNADMGAGGGGGMGAKGAGGGMGGSGRPGGGTQGESGGDKPLRDGGGMGAGPQGGSGGGGPQGAAQGNEGATTYKTAEDYIAHLNDSVEWVKYDAAKNAAKIAGLAGFVAACKTPSKDIGAFDALDRSQGENDLFGNDGSDSLHFDACMAGLLADNKDGYAQLENWNDSYPNDYADDLKQLDGCGASVQQRVDLYNPLYYLCASYEGAGTSTPAANWRIRTGIEQGDTALTTEINLALALAGVLGEDAVDFETVWGLGHTMAESTGSATENFIAWVKECAAA